MGPKFRTAVLVVHGMGSQRPLDTVRGVVNAVWFDNDDHTADPNEPKKRLWAHPEPSGVDLDLTVMTTSRIKTSAGMRNVDFHELYWAHLMSETKAVAVLLWLFELGRKGPNFQTGMNGLWWCGAIFLCLLLLSVAQLAIQGMVWFAGITEAPHGIPISAYLMISVGVVVSLIAACWKRYFTLGAWLAAIAVGLAVIAAEVWILIETLEAGRAPPAYWLAAAALIVAGIIVCINGHRRLGQVLLILGGVAVVAWILGAWLHLGPTPVVLLMTKVLLTPVIAFLAVDLLMGKHGIRAFGWAYAASLGFFALYEFLVWFGLLEDSDLSTVLQEGRLPWSLGSSWSTVAALLIIGVYIIVNAAFLQPYLGDAARYFRNAPANVAVRRAIRKNAVDTLDRLHRSRLYDRIVVVAHSLGTVVAYDMLRAYYSRICRQIPIDNVKSTPEFNDINTGPACGELRNLSRRLIATIVANSALLSVAPTGDRYQTLAATTEVDAWLVTDFVTLGSPLTHAQYLMINEDDERTPAQAFEDHVRERELPTCPPVQLDEDRLLSFTTPEGEMRMHHGGLFAMTRWTNLYFPMKQIFWGDAIGGPVRDVFRGFANVGCAEDQEVWTERKDKLQIFTHTQYWNTKYPDGRRACHIDKLRNAVNLEDK